MRFCMSYFLYVITIWLLLPLLLEVNCFIQFHAHNPFCSFSKRSGEFDVHSAVVRIPGPCNTQAAISASRQQCQCQSCFTPSLLTFAIECAICSHYQKIQVHKRYRIPRSLIMIVCPSWN
jgi:hypothetical protein